MNFELVEFREDFKYKKQRRKVPAKKKWKQTEIAGADFETKDGYPHIFTWTVYQEGKYVDYHTVFGGTEQDPEMFLKANGGKEEPPFSIRNFCQVLFDTGKFTQGGSKKKGGKQRKRKTPPQLYFFNLQFDAQAIVKCLPTEIIELVMLGEDCVLDTIDNKMVELEEGAKLPFNRYIRIAYIHKKFLQLEPLNFYSKGVRWGKVSCWDIRQFLGGGSLDFNAKKHLNEGKLDFTQDQMALLGSLSNEGIKFTNDNWDKIIEYAEKDSNLTARLSWKVVNDFESNGVRMVKPFSPASVAERACYDSCDIPILDDFMKVDSQIIKAFWTCYQGGHFEAVGSGIKSQVSCWDITSAYPAVMWHLPDCLEGVWEGTFNGDKSNDGWDYLKNTHKMYWPSAFECEVIFPKGKIMYPASKKSEVAKCLMNARINYGWFTGDEIKEFQKWNAKITIFRWTGFIPVNTFEDADDVEDGIRYPFRPFVERFYGMKLEQDTLKAKGSKEYDVERRNLAKLMINSLYGKTVAGVEKQDGLKHTGQMWNPIYGAVITAGCRMRMAEMIRVNGYDSVLSVATDGIIFDASQKEVIVPKNPMPVKFKGKLNNLGDWEDDGKGTLLLMMSGVYSVIKDFKAKTTFRGTYSLFRNRYDEAGKCIEDIYGDDWLQFCLKYEDEKLVVRNENINPTSRPYSIGEAKMKKDYKLVNQFRIVDVSISACGDSNKRKWKDKPKTFGDLANKWWENGTWESMI